MDSLCLFDTNIVLENNENSSINRRIACCGRYQECSDAGQCVSTNTEIKQSCLYHQNLKEGRVFYGKHANGFDAQIYQSLIAEIQTLDESGRTLLAQIAKFYFEDCYLVSGAWVYCTETLNQLIRLQLFRILKDSHALFPKFKQSYIKAQFKERYIKSTDDVAYFKTLRTKEKLNDEIMKNHPEFISQITEPFRYIDFSASNRIYFIELYRDGFFDTKNAATFPLPLLTEKIFLKAVTNH